MVLAHPLPTNVGTRYRRSLSVHLSSRLYRTIKTTDSTVKKANGSNRSCDRLRLALIRLIGGRQTLQRRAVRDVLEEPDRSVVGDDLVHPALQWRRLGID